MDNLKQHISSLNQKISNLEQEKYNLAKQKDQTIDILSKELNKGVNVNYLRNVLISFLTSKEESVSKNFLFKHPEDKNIFNFRARCQNMLNS